MGIYAKVGKRNFSPIKEGLYPAVLVGAYDIGTVTNTTYKSRNRKVVLSWQVQDETIIIQKDGELVEVNREISKVYTLSMHERANLRQDLESWRGRKFKSDEDAESFDIGSMLGQSCLLNIVHSYSGGKVYANIDGITSLIKGQKPVEPEGTLISYSIETDGLDIPEATPKWIREKIVAAPEYEAITRAGNSDEPPPNLFSDVPDIPGNEGIPAVVATGEYLKPGEQSECPF